ncbi:hypothetical protein DPMN_065716 [Dreissena polymorpha]|uniref:Peptidase S1 domain-containing protein n=1 Tax=Dreissena polymorpha TaxID=45954 RepID=A0A9D3YVX8_DREPO|nr:hypothetical protein DPMN_065716 [Dreissena polymorpha]
MKLYKKLNYLEEMRMLLVVFINYQRPEVACDYNAGLQSVLRNASLTSASDRILALRHSIIMVGYLLAFVFLIASANGDTISRIINGSPTTIASHPHQISLQRSKWVVTAAHCVEGSSASTLQVVLTNGFLSDPNRKSYAVRRVIMVFGFDSDQFIFHNLLYHPNYNVGSGAYPHDIALLELTSDADLSGTNKAIELATTGENFDRQACEISGWGHTVTGNNIFNYATSAHLRRRR